MERRLFIFGKEVIRVAVEDHFAHPLHRHQRLGDQLGWVQQIEVEGKLILFGDQLQAELILGKVTGFNGFPQIAAVEVGIAPGQLLRLVPNQRGFARHRLPVEADEGGLTLGVYQAEGMDPKALHRPVAARQPAIGHRPHDVMQRFGLQGDVVPEGVVSALPLRHGAVRFGLHGVDEVRKFQRVLDKEDRRIVAHEVENPLVGIELGGESADIAHRIGGAGAALYGREADKYRRFLRRVGEKIGFGDVAQAAIGLKIAVCGRATGVNDTFRDTLMVKVRDFLTHNKVFQ